MSGSQSRERNRAKKCQGQDLGRNLSQRENCRAVIGDFHMVFEEESRCRLTSGKSRLCRFQLAAVDAFFGGGIGGVLLPEVKLESSILFASRVGGNLGSLLVAITTYRGMSRLTIWSHNNTIHRLGRHHKRQDGKH